MKILANDGLHEKAINLLESKGFEVIMTKVAQEQVANYINKNNIEILIISKATRVDEKLINNTNNLKAVAKLSDDFEDIDLVASKKQKIKLFKANHATIQSKAEIIIAHLLTGAKQLHQTNRELPLEGDTNFKELHKYFSQGHEIKGKTIGLIGIDEIGIAVAKLAIGLGMNVIYYHPTKQSITFEINILNLHKIKINLNSIDKEIVLQSADYISIHLEEEQSYIIDEKAFGLLKKGVGLVNIQRGKIIDEVALIDALNDNSLSFAGLDAFENQPFPEIQLLMHPKISMSPNIASNNENTEEKIGMEVANLLIENFKPIN